MDHEHHTLYWIRPHGRDTVPQGHAWSDLFFDKALLSKVGLAIFDRCGRKRCSTSGPLSSTQVSRWDSDKRLILLSNWAGTQI